MGLGVRVKVSWGLGLGVRVNWGCRLRELNLTGG